LCEAIGVLADGEPIAALLGGETAAAVVWRPAVNPRARTHPAKRFRISFHP